MISIVDYGMGNVKSVFNAIEYLGEDAVVTDNERVMDDSSHIILPGVGAFGDAMDNLKNRGLVEILKRQVFDKGKAFLGICLGMQLIARSSEELGSFEGLGWIPGDVVKFDVRDIGLKLPHVGWNDIKVTRDNPLFMNIPHNAASFYFVHTYHFKCDSEKDVFATSEYGETFTAVVGRDNIIATQFHPEKSQDNGLQFLDNFINWKV